MKKRKYQKFSQPQIELLISMNKQGFSNSEIAETLGKTPSQVAQKKNQLGLLKGMAKTSDKSSLSHHKRRWTASEVLSLKQMYYKRMMDASQISDELGRTEKSILNKIRDLEKMPERYEETTLLWGMVKFKYPVR